MTTATDQPSETAELIAATAFQPIVSGNVGVTDISLTDLARILSGDVTNWNRVGGTDLAITVLSTFNDTPTKQAMRDLIRAPAGKSLTENNLITLEDDVRLVEGLPIFPGAISVTPAQLADGKSMLTIQSCIAPTGSDIFRVKSRRHALTVPVTLTASGAEGAAFLTDWSRFLRSDTAAETLRQAGHAGLQVQRISEDRRRQEVASQVARALEMRHQRA
ncbi:hypothetical protein [Actibacterium sp. 188UL27-1]|uniref:hypothetical protein n=1 Tax=Actibacterium sp. 188UL27-1 TaxID=2786961 RepID=UPI00195AB167|nr:hypothetical protein [Actibacterium sp. 188UL27-1]MBM7067054.1 hypothetical protein [Actibacterium sp. 188UL27-1]